MTHDRSKKRQRKSTDDRRLEIIDVALGIIARQGARNFTAKNIASEIGITPGAIFRHFATMNDIVEAAIDRVEVILFEDVASDDPDSLKRLEMFFHNRIEVILRNRDIACMLLSDHLQQAASEQQAGRVEQFKVRSRAHVQECLEGARDEGALGATEPEAAAVLVQGAILALANASTGSSDTKKLEKLSTKVWSLLEQTLRGGRPL